jgi:hypothetical protein
MRSLTSLTRSQVLTTVCQQFQTVKQTTVTKVMKVRRLAASEENVHFTVLLGNETMYVKRNQKARSRNHCYGVKGTSTKYYESLLVLLP